MEQGSDQQRRADDRGGAGGDQGAAVPEPDLARIEQEAAQSLANRLQARAAADTPGFLLLNPCSFTRRVALELEGIDGVLPTGGPLNNAPHVVASPPYS